MQGLRENIRRVVDLNCCKAWNVSTMTLIYTFVSIFYNLKAKTFQGC